MVTQELWTTGSFGRKLLEEISHGLRVIPSFVHDDRAYCISLRLVPARIFQHQSLRAELNAGLRQRTQWSPSCSAKNRSGNASDLGGRLRLPGLFRGVLHVDV